MDEAKWNSFLRQRRALLVVSLVLAFAQLAQISLDKINFLGNELTVRSPIAVNIALWVFWLYWLFRFYVYSCDVDAVIMTRQRYNLKLYQLLRDRAPKPFQHDPNIIARLKEVDAAFTGASIQNAQIYGHSAEGYKIGVSKLSVEYVKADGVCGVLEYGDSKTVVTHEHTRPIKHQAVRYVIFHTPTATDFWLPYLVAAVPVLIVLVQGIAILITNY